MFVVKDHVLMVRMINRDIPWLYREDPRLFS